MWKKLLSIRHISLVITFFIVIVALGLIVLGAGRIFFAVIELSQIDRFADHDFRPGLLLIEAVDVFLIALVFIVFAVGINVLFIRHDDEEYLLSIPKWMRVRNFAELKFLLMEAIITTLFVMFVTVFVKKMEHLEWDMLIIPVAILLLSVSLRVLKSGEDHNIK